MLDDLDKAANSKEQLTEAQVKKLQDKWGKDLQNPFCVQAMADAYRAKHGKDANFSDMLNRLAVNTAGPAYIPNESERATRASFTERIGTALWCFRLVESMLPALKDWGGARLTR